MPPQAYRSDRCGGLVLRVAYCWPTFPPAAEVAVQDLELRVEIVQPAGDVQRHLAPPARQLGKGSGGSQSGARPRKGGCSRMCMELQAARGPTHAH